MKLNWKALIAVLVLVATIVWGVSSLRSYSYSGTDLNVGIGSGPVTVTNPTDEALPVSLVSTKPGTFIILSNASGVEGRSTTQSSGRNASQRYEFALPPGVSEFTVSRGIDVSFVATSEAALELVVQPLNSDDARNTLIIMVILIAGSFYYLSHSNGHRLMSAARRQKAVDQAAAQQAERENFKRIYGRAGSGK
jgi:hypothetical protein